MDRYKVWLVAKGFTQLYGIDYQETFAPIAKLNKIRVLLLLANWPFHQMDIKNVFLNGNLEKKVYMEIPSCLKTKININEVCKLKNPYMVSSNRLELGLIILPKL